MMTEAETLRNWLGTCFTMTEAQVEEIVRAFEHREHEVRQDCIHDIRDFADHEPNTNARLALLAAADRLSHL